MQRIAIPHQVAEAARTGTPRGNLSDLYPRWLGARELLLHHRDPYSHEIAQEAQAGYYGRPIDASRPQDPKDQQAFAYPLYVVFALAPTIRFPFPEVQRGFVALLMVLTVCSVLFWLHALRWRVSRISCLLWIILTLGCFPAIQGFKLQQLTLLVAGLMAISLSLLAGGYLSLSGVCLALASIKPQLVVLPVAWLCLWTLGKWRERRNWFLGFGFAIAALIGGGEFLLPGWITEFRRASAEYWIYTGGGRSVLDVVLTPYAGRAVSAALVCLLLYWVWRLRQVSTNSFEFAWLLGLTMATTLAVIPMFAPYNQVLLLPALMVIARTFPSLWQAGRWSRYLVGLTIFVIAWPWLASTILVLGLLLFPASSIQKAWVLPLLTNFWIPLLTLGLLLFKGPAMRNPEHILDYRGWAPNPAPACERS